MLELEIHRALIIKAINRLMFKDLSKLGPHHVQLLLQRFFSGKLRRMLVHQVAVDFVAAEVAI